MFLNFFKAIKNYKRYNKGSSNNQIIFFSEGTHHWAHLKFLIFYCVQKYKVKYITLSLKDDGLNFINKNFDSFYLGNLFILNLFFRKMNSKYFITSLPDLGKLYFKKYNNNCTFIYIFHSLASAHFQYNRDAFDNYDVILCSGPHHLKEMRESEKYYNTKRKKLYKYGYPRLEEIKKNKTNKVINKNKIILVAPSWGPNSITNLCIKDILENLITNNFKIIYRPHTMSLIKDKKIIGQILKKYIKFDNFEFDNSNSSFNNMLKADLMIADWGSTAADFTLGLDKPIIFINTPPKIINKDFKNIFSLAFESQIRNEIGQIIDIDNLSDLSKTIMKILDNNIDLDKNTKFINRYVYNFLNSEKEIIKIVEDITDQ